MATPESVKTKIQRLIDTANATTGSSSTDLTTSVNALISGFNGKAEQEKSVDITVNNSTTEVVPDDGKVLTKVMVNVEIPKEGWTIDELVNPSSLSGDLVYNGTDFNTQVCNSLFAYRTGITSVIMENYTGSIPSFRQCNSLTWFYFPSCTSSIGQGLNGTGFSGTVYLNKMAPALTKLGAPTLNGLPNVTRVVFPATVQTFVANTLNVPMQSLTSICILGVPTTMPATTFNSNITSIADIYVPWAENEVANAPWGATNATIHYSTTFDENGDPIV